MRGKVIIATLLALSTRARAAGPVVEVTVKDGAGRPLPYVMVIAADTTKVIAMALSDQAGGARLPAPRPRYNFGLLSPRLRLHGVTPRGPRRYDLIAETLPPAAETRSATHNLIKFSAPRAMVFRGRIVDQTGVGLRAVRVEAVRPGGSGVSTVLSQADGAFALVVPAGEYRLRASAPGLTAVSGVLENGRMTVVMAVDTEVQSVTVISGHTLTFRTSDSIDPEYAPPPPVRTWLRFAYGICPTGMPLKAHEKRSLKKYWYLDVLRTEPPNPATISTVNCTPPSEQERMPPGQADLGGFQVWEEALGAVRDE
jgi:hypothetical protein